MSAPSSTPDDGEPVTPLGDAPNPPQGADRLPDGELFEDETPGTGDTFRKLPTSPLHRPRQWIAIGLLVLVAALAVLIVSAAFFTSDANYERVKEIAPIVFSPLVTLLGTAVAWFYATEKKN